MDRIRKLESELRETKAVNLQSKQIRMATMKDDVDKVEQLRQEVEKMAQEKKDMQRRYETKLTEMSQERGEQQGHFNMQRPCKKRRIRRNPMTNTATVLKSSDKR